MDSKISDNLTYREATFSQNAIKHGLDNTPNAEQLENLKALGVHVFEPLRHVSGDRSIRTIIMFRNGKLRKSIITDKLTSVNELAGGDPLSQHKCIGGNAAGDFDNDGLSNRAQNNELFLFAYNNTEVNFDKIIAENIDNKGHVDWIHLSYNRKRDQRRVSSVMFFCEENGKPKKVYRTFDIQKGFIRSKYLIEGEA